MLDVNGLLAGNKSASTFAPAPEAIGGERDLYVERTSPNAGAVSTDVNMSIPGAYSYASGPMTTGYALLVWDGVDGNGNSNSINFTGLSSADVTENGVNVGFLIRGASDLGATVVLTVYTDANNSSKATVTLPADPSFMFHDFFVPFSSFGIDQGAGANFAQVGAITLLIDGRDRPATDVGVDLILAREIAQTPEPATIVLLGIGMISLGIAAHRRRKK
jgi:hypothetical protein